MSSRLDGIIDDPPVQHLDNKGVFVSKIFGVHIAVPQFYHDVRGATAEIYRADEDILQGRMLLPAMGYYSWSNGGVRRGPHEHKYQTDIFFFIDGSSFILHLWDNRNPDHTVKEKIATHEAIQLKDCTRVIIPPGVVHGYRNVTQAPAGIMNFPDMLYRGKGKNQPPDEFRWELEEDSIFKF